MTPRCLLCGGVVVGAHFHGIDPEQRCDACDTLADLRGAAVCACSLADLRRALAEQAAGEAERVREAVAREREACAVLCETWTDVYPGASYARGCAARIRARATSPAPEPHPAGRAATDAAKTARARGEDVYADGEGRCEVAPEPVAAERAVIEAAVAWRASLDGPGECWHEARMRDAVDALAAARKGGG